MYRIRIGLHYTWIFAAILLIVIIYTLFPEAYVVWKRLLLGAGASLFFLVVLLLRQLPLNYLAVHRGIRLRRVTCYIFGGVPGITRQDTSFLKELLLGTSGLLLSFLIVIIIYSVYVVFVVLGFSIIGDLTLWMVTFFIIFIAFHLIPAYPTDAGRILRAFIWKATGDYDRATRITSEIGVVYGFLLIAGGAVLIVLNRDWLAGATMVISGWSFFTCASSINNAAYFRQLMRSTIMKDIRGADFLKISPQESVESLVINHILTGGYHFVAVVDDEKMIGSVTSGSLKKVPRKTWKNTKLKEVMLPVENQLTADVSDSAADVLEKMIEMDVSWVPILDGSQLSSVVSRERMVDLSKIRKEFRITGK